MICELCDDITALQASQREPDVRLKSSLTPLDQVGLLTQPDMMRLQETGVTTLEEFVGVLESDPEGIRALLELTESDFGELRRAAVTRLRPEVRKAFDHQKGRRFPRGALDPRLRGDKS